MEGNELEIYQVSSDLIACIIMVHLSPSPGCLSKYARVYCLGIGVCGLFNYLKWILLRVSDDYEDTHTDVGQYVTKWIEYLSKNDGFAKT